MGGYESFSLAHRSMHMVPFLIYGPTEIYRKCLKVMEEVAICLLTSDSQAGSQEVKSQKVNGQSLTDVCWQCRESGCAAWTSLQAPVAGQTEMRLLSSRFQGSLFFFPHAMRTLLGNCMCQTC